MLIKFEDESTSFDWKILDNQVPLSGVKSSEQGIARFDNLRVKKNEIRKFRGPVWAASTEFSS